MKKSIQMIIFGLLLGFGYLVLVPQAAVLNCDRSQGICRLTTVKVYQTSVQNILLEYLHEAQVRVSSITGSKSWSKRSCYRVYLVTPQEHIGFTDCFRSKTEADRFADPINIFLADKTVGTFELKYDNTHNSNSAGMSLLAAGALIATGLFGSFWTLIRRLTRSKRRHYNPAHF